MDKHMEETRKWNALPEGHQETAVAAAENNRKWNTIRTGLYTIIAIMLIMSAVMGSAWAYFTSYSRAKGSVALKLGHEEHIIEDLQGWQKILDIESTEDSNPVYLRMRAYCAEYDVTYDNNKNWTGKKADGWIYYEKALQPGKTLSNPDGDDKTDDSDALLAKIEYKEDPELKDGKTFNVIVVYESTEVQYDEQGNMIDADKADWSRPVDTKRRSSTLGGE